MLLSQVKRPVSVIGNYQAEVNAYTKGTAGLYLRWQHRPCHNTEEVIENSAMSLSVIQETR